MLSVKKFRVVIVGRDALRNQCTSKICHKYAINMNNMNMNKYFFFPEMEKMYISRLPGAQKSLKTTALYTYVELVGSESFSIRETPAWLYGQERIRKVDRAESLSS